MFLWTYVLQPLVARLKGGEKAKQGQGASGGGEPEEKAEPGSSPVPVPVESEQELRYILYRSLLLPSVSVHTDE